MSQQLADIVSNYVAGKRLYLHPAAANLYEGAWHPALPPVEEVTDDKIEKPHWLPTTLRLVPMANGHRKYGRLARIKLKS